VATIASAASKRRRRTKGEKQATSRIASACSSAPTAVAKLVEEPIPDSIADPVARARAMTTFEQMRARPISTYRRFRPCAEGCTLAAKISGPHITAT
jgi:hypothetical protein